MPAPGRRQVATLVHAALMGGVVVVTTVLALVRPTAGPGALPGPWLLYGVFGVAAASCAAALILASRLPADTPAGVEDWWAARLPQVMVVWALLDAPALLAAVAHFLTGSPLPFVITAVVLGLFLLHAPGRIRGD